MELIREIEEQDIPQLKELLSIVFGDDSYNEIQRLDGMTNHSYKIVREDEQVYVVRLPGEGTETLINRLDERKSTELACRLRIDAELLYFGDDGRKVSRFIKNPQPMNRDVMCRKENICQAAEILHRLHTCGENTGIPFEVFEMASLYEKIIHENHVSFYQDYDYIKQAVMSVKSSIDTESISVRVPCHNDPLIGNWVLDSDERLYLIDWEYSGMNEPMWDLSCLSIEAEYNDELDDALLTAYYGRRPDNMEKKRFLATKTYVDYLWTLWGLTRVPFDGEFMQNYADQRYARLKRYIADFRKA